MRRVRPTGAYDFMDDARQLLEAESNAPVCPRCGGFIPNSEQPGAYPGALSRTDNDTEVCSQCGTEEAMEQMSGGAVMPQTFWKFPPAR